MCCKVLVKVIGDSALMALYRVRYLNDVQNMKSHNIILVAVICAFTSILMAKEQDGNQPAGGQPPNGAAQGQGPGGQPPKSPILEALDTNHDRTIDAEELSNASESLKTLDKNGDGKLTRDEMHPPRPNSGQGQGAQGQSGKVGQGLGGPHPKFPIIEVLDKNHNHTIDADEIAKATELLKKLDKNGDDQLAEEEIRPPRPGGHGHGGQNTQGGQGQNGPGAGGSRPSGPPPGGSGSGSRPSR